jgi:uncharacterized protein YdcH (DUF465 family)
MSKASLASYKNINPMGGYVMDRVAAIQALSIENDEFKRIRDKHKAFEKELEEFGQRRYLTSDEELAIKQIKKNKLVLKDKMEKIIDIYVKNN